MYTNASTAGETALEAFGKAKESHSINITTETASVLEALARFNDAAFELTDSICDNMPAEQADNDTLDGIFNGFYELYEPLRDYLNATIGKIVLRQSFSTIKFNGI